MPTPRYSVLTASSDHHVGQVIALADRYTHFLGRFPRAAFEREAQKQRILAAVDDNDVVLGYILYRTTRDRAVVQHLCVDAAARQRGIARALSNELKSRTSHLPGIICHCAKQFADSIDTWKKLGFVPMGEKPGRGKNRRPLIRLLYDHGHEHLFSETLRIRANNTLVAVMDVNIAIAMQDDVSRDTEITALQADWLQEEVSLWVADEALCEVERQDDQAERQRRMAFLRGFPAPSRDTDREAAVVEQLRQFIHVRDRSQDHSDIRQLAQAIVGDADAFITRDERLLKAQDVIHESFGMRVVRPIDIILLIDELARVSAYAPARLHETSLEVRRPRSDELQSLIDRFHNHGSTQRKHAFAKLVRQAMADPSQNLSVIHATGRGAIGLVICTAEVPHLRRITAFRLLRGPLAETLSRHLLLNTVRTSLTTGASVVVLADPAPTFPVDSSAVACGFESDGDHTWRKRSYLGVRERSSVSADMARFDGSEGRNNAGLSLLDGGDGADAFAPQKDVEVERRLWPVVLKHSDIRSFVVPIQPRFACHLFDARLSAKTLFGGDPALLLNCENVYYRSGRVPVVSSPSRIVWYVSKDETNTVQAARAWSPVIATHVGSAKDLFNRFSHLGVYQWKDVLAVAKGDAHAAIMAIHFGPTHIFGNPIAASRLRPMIARHRGTASPPPLSMPVKIPQSCFEEIYQIAESIPDSATPDGLDPSAIQPGDPGGTQDGRATTHPTTGWPG